RARTITHPDGCLKIRVVRASDIFTTPPVRLVDITSAPSSQKGWVDSIWLPWIQPATRQPAHDRVHELGHRVREEHRVARTGLNVRADIAVAVRLPLRDLETCMVGVARGIVRAHDHRIEITVREQHRSWSAPRQRREIGRA